MTRPGISCRPGVGYPGKPKIGKSTSQRCLMLRPALPAGLAEDRSRRQQDVLSQRELQCCAPARGGTWTQESAPSLSLQQIFSLLPNKLQHFFVIWLHRFMQVYWSFLIDKTLRFFSASPPLLFLTQSLLCGPVRTSSAEPCMLMDTARAQLPPRSAFASSCTPVRPLPAKRPPAAATSC